MGDEVGAADNGVPTVALDGDVKGFEALLDYLHRNRGFDFARYKRSTLSRRIHRRMQTVSVAGYAEYIDYLEVRPDEFPQLFNTILINVTAYFRDPATWDVVRDLVESRVRDHKKDQPFRVWCAGCASGEEAYTIAMLLAELLGPEQYVDRVKIYATDIDEEALAEARLATYSPRAVEGVPPALLEKYFTKTGGGYIFAKDLRRGVIFGRHDLVQDAPISRVDLLTCRNALMYFNTEAQTRILKRLHFALNDGGILVLGKAEMLLSHANLFTPIDLKLRVFERTKGRVRDRLLAAEPATLANDSADDRIRLYRSAFERAPTAQLVLDGEGKIALINNRAAQLFLLTSEDVGRPFHDLEISYRPAELRSSLDRVKRERRPTHLREVERTLPGGEQTYLDIELLPLLGDAGAVIGTQLNFSDITESHRLQSELRKANTELEGAHEALQSASEELETTNEELQSTVEELETTNEELQSTNEELETMNEELQSTNEELQAMNEELRQRSTELGEVSAFMSAILGSMRTGVVVLDRELLVRAWNRKMEELWGMRAEEVEGKPFMTLDIGLPIDHLATAIRASLSNGDEVERVVDATNRRGRAVRCRITVTPVKSEPNRGVTLVVEEIEAP